MFRNASMIGGLVSVLLLAGTAFSQEEPTEAPPVPTAEVPAADQAEPAEAEPAYAEPAYVAPRRVAQVPGNPHKTLYYNNDFSYLEDPGSDDSRLGDRLKRRSVGDCVTVDVGGEYRARHQNEHLLNRTSDFLLHRTRVYANVEYGSWFRFYGEGIDAVSDFDDVTPRGIEENRFDALNLFGDLRVLDRAGGQLWFRGGRQELLYGSQRLVSPLDWANTRRTFDGLKLFWKGDDWDVDLWWTRPVPFGQHITGGFTDHNFDRSDESQEFIGLWLSRKTCKNRKLDLYFLRLAEYDANPTLFDESLIGARWEGQWCNLLLEAEGGYQFGDFGADDHTAGFFTMGLGRKLDLAWDPVVWVYYDWASGDEDPSDGSHDTFNQLFPLGHKYFGYMDLVARQNIEDFNFRITASPHKKVQLTFWWHVFHLDEARDALYNAAGTAIRQDATGAAGTDVGQELDLTAKFLLTPRADLLFGYSHLYSGAFLAGTPGGVAGEDFYFGQFSVRF